MNLPPKRPSSRGSTFFFLSSAVTESVVLMGHLLYVLGLVGLVFTRLFNIISSKLLLFDLQDYSYNCHSFTAFYMLACR